MNLSQEVPRNVHSLTLSQALDNNFELFVRTQVRNERGEAVDTYHLIRVDLRTREKFD